MTPVPVEGPGVSQVAEAKLRRVFGALVLLASTGFAFSNGGLLVDPDIWWHVKTGADMWSSASFPALDQYSYTNAGQPWIAKEWLGQILLYFSFALGHWNGVWLTGALTIGLLAVVLYWFVSAHLRPVVAVMVTLLSLLAVSDFFHARPFLFAIPVSVIWTYHLFERARVGRAPNFLALALLIVWANLHAMFTIGFAIGFFAFLEYLERWKFADRKTLLLWVVFLVLCPAVTLVHPYGHDAILATFFHIGENDSKRYVNEWMPFNAQREVKQELAIIVFLFVSFAARLRIGWARALFLALLFHLFFSYHRFGSVLFPILPALVAPLLAERFAGWKAGTRAAADSFEGLIVKFHRPIAGLLVSLAVLVYAALLLVLPVKHEAPLGSDAIAYAKRAGLTGNVMNDYLFGGPLIFYGVPTYIDGRTDQLFFGKLLDDDEKMQKLGGQTVFVEALERYKITWTLFTPDDARVQYLDAMPGWRRAYEDPYAVIHVPVPGAPR